MYSADRSRALACLTLRRHCDPHLIDPLVWPCSTPIHGGLEGAIQSVLPLRKSGQLAIPTPPNWLVLLFTHLCSKRVDIAQALVWPRLAGDQNTFRFDTGRRPAPSWLAVPNCRRVIVTTKAGIDDEIPQRLVQRRASALSREPRWMREAPGRTEQDVRLCRGCKQILIRHGFVSYVGSAAPNSTAIPPPLSAFAFTNVRASRRSAARRARCSSACVCAGLGAR